MEHMQIRMATIDDLDAITSVEAECFPPAEAATKEEFARRIKAYGTHFWLLCEKGYEGEKLIAFVDGMVTDKKNLTDEMYEKAELHEVRLSGSTVKRRKKQRVRRKGRE